MLQNIKRIAHAITSHVLCFPTLLHKFLDSCLSILWAFELQQRLISRRLPNVLWPNVWGSKQYVNTQLFIWTFQFNLLLCFFTRNNVLIILWWTQLKNTLKSMTFINTEVFFSRNICFVWLWNTSLFCFTWTPTWGMVLLSTEQTSQKCSSTICQWVFLFAEPLSRGAIILNAQWCQNSSWARYLRRRYVGSNNSPVLNVRSPVMLYQWTREL